MLGNAGGFAADRLGERLNPPTSYACTVSTIYEEAKRAAKEAAASARDIVQNPGKAVDAARDKAAALVEAVDRWRSKPPEEKLDDLALVAASATEEAAMGAAGRMASSAVGGLSAGRKLEKAGGTLADSRKARKAAARAARAEEEVATHAAVPAKMPAASSRAARREAMREAGIPTSQQPSAQRRTSAGMQYEYEVSGRGGQPVTKIVTQQTTDRVPGHGPHWEAGVTKAKDDLDPLGRLRVRNGKSKVEYTE